MKHGERYYGNSPKIKGYMGQYIHNMSDKDKDNIILYDAWWIYLFVSLEGSHQAVQPSRRELLSLLTGS